MSDILADSRAMMASARAQVKNYGSVGVIIANNTDDSIRKPPHDPRRKLTVAEIEKIVDVIGVWPSRVEAMGVALQQRQREIIRAKLATCNVINDSRAVDMIATELRGYWLRGIVPAGTPLGYIVGDDSAAAVMQGTLNTRHKPGSRQNASGGIKNQREIILLTQRSNPVVIASFESPQTFRSIMEEWRPKWVHTTLAMLSPESHHTQIRRFTEEPDWWNQYRRSVAHTTPTYTPGYYLEIELDRQMLMTYSISLSSIRTMLYNSVKNVQSSAFDVYFTPLVFSKVLIHIVPLPTHVESLKQPGLPGEAVFFEQNLTTWRSTLITGLPGVRAITPISKKVMDAIRNETLLTSGITRLNLVRETRRFFGVGHNQVAALASACGLTPLAHDASTPEDTLFVRTPRFEPMSWLLTHSSVRSTYGATKQSYDNGNGWSLYCASSEAATMISGYFNSKKIAATVNSSIVTISLSSIPVLSAIDEIKAMQTIDQEIRTQGEEARRTARIENHTDDTILSSTITSVEAASHHWMAEISGGDLRTILREEGVDQSITFSNDTKEINRIFGIRAARTFLILEIEETWSNSGAPLQPVSIVTIADSMVYSGSLTPSSMAGVTSTRMGFQARMTVHAASKWLSLAAVNGEADHIRSAASAIMTSKRNRSGTGIVDIIETTPNDYSANATQVSPHPDGVSVIREYVVTKDD